MKRFLIPQYNHLPTIYTELLPKLATILNPLYEGQIS